MSSTDIFPRKWSIRYSCDSSMSAWSVVVQLARGREVVPERLLDDDARVLREAGVRESARRPCRRATAGSRGRRPGCVLPSIAVATSRVRRRIGEVAVVVREPLREPPEDLLVELLARRDDRVARALDELLERPVVERDADDRAVEEPARLEPVQRAVRHDAGEVAGDPEDHEHVGRPRPAVRLPVHGQSISASRRARSKLVRPDGAAAFTGRSPESALAKLANAIGWSAPSGSQGGRRMVSTARRVVIGLRRVVLQASDAADARRATAGPVWAAASPGSVPHGS